MISSFKSKVSSFLKETYVSKFDHIPKESQFLAKGVLTPSEFIEAGNQLVKMCPSWKWMSAIDEKHKKSTFPDNKQYLYTEVPCHKRARGTSELKTYTKDLEDGWTGAECEGDDTKNDEKEATKKLDAMMIMDELNEKGNEEVKEDEEEDNEGIKVRVSVQKEKKAEEDEDDLIVVETPSDSETRYYELTITYDFYYLTPRIWLAGYSQDRIPLSADAMFEDIMEEYANKTVTYEPHPHTGVNQLSIHPCKHANVMKHLIDIAADKGDKIDPSNAMFILLKFISSVVPTMEYDFTIDF